MPHNRITAFSPAQCAYPWWHSTQMVRGHAQVPQPMVETSQHGTYNIGMLDCGEVRVYPRSAHRIVRRAVATVDCKLDGRVEERMV